MNGTLKTLAIGALGAAVAQVLGLPLAPLLGALAAVLVAGRRLQGLTVAGPARLAGLVLAGIFLGSRFPPDLMTRVVEWPVTLIAIMVYSVLGIVLATLYFRRIAGYDKATALFSAIPGGVLTMMALGDRTGGRVETIMLSHSFRIMLAVVTIPLALVHGSRVVTPPPLLGTVTPVTFALLVVVGGAAALAGRRLRIPAAEILAPMFATAALYIFAGVHGEFPSLAFAFGLWVAGSALGTQITGLTFRAMGGLLVHSAVVFVILAALSAAFAFALHGVSSEPLANLFLAFTPGGIAEMSGVSVALGHDPAFVGTHHAVRILTCSVLAPIIAARLSPARTVMT